MKINVGDYINTTGMTKEQVQEFVNLCVSRGVEFGEGMAYFGVEGLPYVGVNMGGIHTNVYWKGELGINDRDITDWYLRKTFTKEDIEDGMKVVYRDGIKRYVLKDMLIMLSEGCSDRLYAKANLAEFNNDLTHLCKRNMDIMEVYNQTGELVWKRKETVELTLVEIAEKMGIPVEQLRIKN